MPPALPATHEGLVPLDKAIKDCAEWNLPYPAQPARPLKKVETDAARPLRGYALGCLRGARLIKTDSSADRSGGEPAYRYRRLLDRAAARAPRSNSRPG